MVGGVFLVDGIAVGEVDGSDAVCQEVVVLLCFRRTVGQLVGEDDGLCAFLVEEALVVHVAAERCPSVAHLHVRVIAEPLTVGTARLACRRGSVVFHVEASEREGGIQTAHVVELVAEAEVPHREGQLHRRAHRRENASVAVLLLHHHVGGAGLRVVHHGIGTVRELSLLAADEDAAAQASVTGRGAHRSVHSVERLHGHRVLTVHHNVQHAACSLGIIACTGIGHHLDILHSRGGHALEHH